MSTTRHLLNRQRRRSAGTGHARTARGSRTGGAPRAAAPVKRARTAAPGRPTDRTPDPGEVPRYRAVPARLAVRPRRPTALAALVCATVLMTGVGLLAANAAGESAPPGTANTALSDSARTSEVSAAMHEAVAAAFSYDHTDPEGSARAAAEVLTGPAVDQHRDLLAEIVAEGPAAELTLETRVTHTGVEQLRGDQARLLVYADQFSSREGDDALAAGAVLAVDAVWQDGRWLIAGIDPFS